MESERVYVVRLNEEDRAELEHLARHQWAFADNPNKPHCKRRLDALESARPEHPKRQEALEKVAYRAMETYFHQPGCLCWFCEAVQELRSLEGKCQQSE